mmetsp:Transcript_16360/g.29683  ORF Transcript_16360/g.29683 Transcript_16360/m.29683 type:complete len:90 (-) Transcript_16360:277-546(-)
MSIFQTLQKFSPAALARGLWGRGPIPPHYKLLFFGQGLIFTMAVLIRTRDVEKAQHIKNLVEAEKLKVEEGGVLDNGSLEKEESVPVDR